MALSPELKRLVSGAKSRHADPLEAKRAEILARLPDYEPSVQEQLARIGLERATKQELREIVMEVMLRDPDA